MRLDAQIPELLGGYRLIRRLGRGGMAEVWLVHKVGDPLEKSWVMKILLPEHTGSVKHQARFLSEVKTLASLRHGRIVPIITHGVDQGFYYLVMEYIDGVNLRVFVKELESKGERLPLPAVVYILGEVTDAVRHAHDRTRAGAPRGVIHRDIKPSNVIISSEGEVFLTDFGLARYEEDFSMEIFGTRAYVAPEQARGAACPQSDIFGIGGILHFMLTGDPPRRVAHHAMDINMLLDDPPPPTGRDDVPEELDRIRRMCLEPSLARRFPSAADLLRIIERYPGYLRSAMMLKEYHLRYFGPPRTGTTEVLAMAKAVEPTEPSPAPARRSAVDAAEDELTTFWQPPADAAAGASDAGVAPLVPPEYRPVPSGRVEADAPKIRRRPRRETKPEGRPPEPNKRHPKPEPTEILPPLSSAARRITTERLTSFSETEPAVPRAADPPPAEIVIRTQTSASGVSKPRIRAAAAVGIVGVITTAAWVAARIDPVADFRETEQSPAAEGAHAPVAEQHDGRTHVEVIVRGHAGGEVELGGQRIALDPVAHTSLAPGRYAVRWRDAHSDEWRDAGTVDITPDDVRVGRLRVELSPTEGARAERRP